MRIASLKGRYDIRRAIFNSVFDKVIMMKLGQNVLFGLFAVAFSQNNSSIVQRELEAD